jgi:hypothetical protein
MRLLSPCLAFSAMATALSAQTLVLPDNHNFMESSTYATNSGDSLEWSGTSAKRFQIIYDASHFTGKAGIPPGGVLITHIKFRGEDGETNSGGQVYSGLVVQLGATSLTSATMVATFGSPTGGGPGTPGSNRDPLLTALGPAGVVPSLTVMPSVGSCPNNYIIDIDLSAIGAAFVFDPHGPMPNLLIDITAPTAPVQVPPMSMIPIQDTVAHGAGIRGKAYYTTAAATLTGSADSTPPVVGIEFVGPGGWPTEIPAKAEYIGGSCGGAHSTIYQAFSQDQAFDLAAGLTFTPDVYPSPTVYTVTLGAPPIDLSQLNAVPDTIALDSLVTHPLGFLVTPFHYPGGVTSTVKPCTNGYMWLDAAMTSASQYNPDRLKLLGNTVATPYTARFMPYWTDEDPTRNPPGNPLSGLHVKTVPESFAGAGDAVCYATWNDIGVFRTVSAPGHASSTYQVVIHEATGVVEFRYGTMMPFFSTTWTSSQHAVIIGFTRGQIAGVNSLDPQSRDLSHELPYVTAVEGTTSNVSLTAVASPIAGSVQQTGRMFGSQTLTYDIANIPAGTIVAWTILDVGASQPGIPIDLFGFAAPTCRLSTSLSPILMPHEQFILPGASVVGTVPLVVPHGWEGTVITAQAIGVDVFGGPYLIPWTSNAIKYTVGLD